jgi:hypothetical protein
MDTLTGSEITHEGWMREKAHSTESFDEMSFYDRGGRVRSVFYDHRSLLGKTKDMARAGVTLIKELQKCERWGHIFGERNIASNCQPKLHSDV